ncbi:MAG: NAD(P)H-hydrate dehydratase [Deltaproteobacteria bacterium]|nr:NAD(P)H-hydrate dehydratase [Deltaproteobacteria bacterium]
MKVVDAPTMKRLDEKAINGYGIPGVVLMENAGRGVADLILKGFPHLLGKPVPAGYKERRVAVFAGKGNNGGDGLVVARHLVNKGIRVTVYLLAKAAQVRGDARINLGIWKAMGGEIKQLLSGKDIDEHKTAIRHAGLIIDAIFGTGLSSPVKGLYKEVIDFINSLNKPVVSIDVPSGLEASTGHVLGVCIRAQVTATMALPKIGFMVYPGAEYAGRVEVIDIGMPKRLLEEVEVPWEVLDKEWINRVWRGRPWNSHKGNFGHLFVLAGSIGKTGAAAMTSLGAMRVGAGLVTLGIPKGLNPVMEEKLTEVMTYPLPDTSSGTIGEGALDSIMAFIQDKKAIALGPGLTTQKEVRKVIMGLIQRCPIPMVIDADGVNILAGEARVLKKANAPIVLTPHPGEMARLVGSTPLDVQSDRIGIASRFARESGCIVVLKGARTVITEPGGRVFINPTGNPGMASGGTGDVLTGMIGGFLAQGYSPLEAAVVGVYLHGLAGDEVAREKGMIGMMAGDILDRIPVTIQNIVVSSQ